VVTWRSLSRKVNHCNSHEVEAKAWYYASTDDLEIVLCFLVFHEINDSPKKMQKPVVERRVMEHGAQSESLKAFK